MPLEVKEAAKLHTVEAIATMVACMRQKGDLRIRLDAATRLLDRGWGKPAMPISGPDGESPVVPQIPELLEQLRRFAAGG